MKQLLRREAGDTIVEVLIAILLVAVILGGAYATANQSLLATRESQERGEALTLAEGQLEGLRGLAQSVTASTQPPPYDVFNEPDIFCLSQSVGGTTTLNDAFNDNPVTGKPIAVSDMPTITEESQDGLTYTGGAGGCMQNFQSGGFFYDVAIDRCDSADIGTFPAAESSCFTYGSEPADSALFIVHVRWDSVNSTTKNEVTLQYRIYEAQS